MVVFGGPLIAWSTTLPAFDAALRRGPRTWLCVTARSARAGEMTGVRSPTELNRPARVDSNVTVLKTMAWNERPYLNIRITTAPGLMPPHTKKEGRIAFVLGKMHSRTPHVSGVSSLAPFTRDGRKKIDEPLWKPLHSQSSDFPFVRLFCWPD